MKEVLIVDDDRVFLRTVKEVFAGDQFSFIEARSPLEAIKILELHPSIRVVLLDLKFKKGDTAETVLRHIKPRADVFRVIILTGEKKILTATTAEAYHVFRYLMKGTGDIAESIRFSLDQAFKDLEKEALEAKSAALLEIHRSIKSRQSLARILTFVCTTLRSLLRAETCHIRIYDFKSGDFRLAGFAGPRGLRREFDVPRTRLDPFSGEVADTGKSRTYEDLRLNPEFRTRRANASLSESSSVELIQYFETVRSAHIVPISTALFELGVHGVINVSGSEIAFFDDRRQSLIEEFADVSGLAIDRDWLENEHEEIHRDYSKVAVLLSDMRTRLARAATLSETFELVTRGISDLINAEVVTIFLQIESSDDMVCVADLRGSQYVSGPSEILAPERSLTRYVIETGDTLLLPDDSELSPVDDRRFHAGVAEGNLAVIPTRRLEHFLASPVWIDGRVRGVIRAMNKKSSYYQSDVVQNPAHPHSARCLLTRGFSGDCRNVLEIAANHLGVAIQSSQMLAEKERQVEREHSVATIAQSLSTSLQLDDVVTLIGDTARSAVDAKLCLVYLTEIEPGFAVLMHAAAILGVDSVSCEIGKGMVGRVVAGSEGMMLQTGSEDGLELDNIILAVAIRSRLGEPGAIESQVCVPITNDETVVGAIHAINKRQQGQHFTTRDLEILRAHGANVGRAIANARMFEARGNDLDIARRNQTLGQLVAAVAHEINNTSGVIPANVSSIRAKLGKVDPDIDKMFDTIVDVSDQATEFANELAGFSSNHVGTKTNRDINVVIRRAIDSIPADQMTNVALHADLPSAPVSCLVFETPLVQVFRNIIMNALQSIAPLPKPRVAIAVSIELLEGGSWATIKFQDNGSGIEPRFREKIFEADFTTKPNGNGIGLWLCRRHLEEVGGTLTLDTTAAIGALFVVRIPLAL